MFEERLVSSCPFCHPDVHLVPNRPPRPWVSFLLSLLIFGGGQFYNGRKARGILTFFGLAAGTFSTWYGIVEFPGNRESGIGLIMAGLVLAIPVWLFSLADAYEDAVEIGTGVAALTERNPRVAALLNLLPRTWGFGYIYAGEVRMGVLLFAAGFVLTIWATRSGLGVLASFLTLVQLATSAHAYAMTRRAQKLAAAKHRARLREIPSRGPWVFRIAAGLIVLFELALAALHGLAAFTPAL
ncbi:MAG: hypothetical protein HYR98_02140 [Nitrospirae bacterium]|nr:hypothetical protein [Nitrospirota bacterium]MBI3392129.1 hypothetical protein [Nitrospirota bacterium]